MPAWHADCCYIGRKENGFIFVKQGDEVLVGSIHRIDILPSHEGQIGHALIGYVEDDTALFASSVELPLFTFVVFRKQVPIRPPAAHSFFVAYP
jgi:hypothetical protein